MSNKRRSSGWSRATIETDEEATLQERVHDVESEQNAEVETDEAVQEQGRVKFNEASQEQAPGKAEQTAGDEFDEETQEQAPGQAEETHCRCRDR